MENDVIARQRKFTLTSKVYVIVSRFRHGSLAHNPKCSSVRLLGRTRNLKFLVQVSRHASRRLAEPSRNFEISRPRQAETFDSRDGAETLKNVSREVSTRDLGLEDITGSLWKTQASGSSA
jgi:hypothetical protein